MEDATRSYGKADLHLHTSLGDGMASVAELLEYVEYRTDLALIAVTDHDQLDAGLLARELHAQHAGYRFEVVAGMEVTTIEGHLLALGIEQPVPSFRSLTATMDAVHHQGGLCVIPHPMSWLTRSIGRHGIERVLGRRADGLWFDGVELSNQSPAARVVNERARRLNRERFHLPSAGGSDAHYLATVGTSYTAYPGRTFADLRAALAAGTSWSESSAAPSLGEIGYGQVMRQMWRGLWATPRQIARRAGRRQQSAASPALQLARGQDRLKQPERPSTSSTGDCELKSKL
jgi:predicted metal-dependent phosphoesterase TrpH